MKQGVMGERESEQSRGQFRYGDSRALRRVFRGRWSAATTAEQGEEGFLQNIARLRFNGAAHLEGLDENSRCDDVEGHETTIETEQKIEEEGIETARSRSKDEDCGDDQQGHQTLCNIL